MDLFTYIWRKIFNLSHLNSFNFYVSSEVQGYILRDIPFQVLYNNIFSLVLLWNKPQTFFLWKVRTLGYPCEAQVGVASWDIDRKGDSAQNSVLWRQENQDKEEIVTRF